MVLLPVVILMVTAASIVLVIIVMTLVLVNAMVATAKLYVSAMVKHMSLVRATAVMMIRR